MAKGPPRNDEGALRHAPIVTEFETVESNSDTHLAPVQLIGDRDADAIEHELLIDDSDRETHAFEIAREIAELNAAESSRASRSVLIETPLARWVRSRRKAQS